MPRDHLILRLPKKPVFTLLALLLALGVAEGIQRVSDWRKRSKREDRVSRWHMRTATGERITDTPGAIALRHDPHLVYRAMEGQDLGVVRINRQGFRGADWEKEKPEGMRRVFVLGGSTAYGLGASKDEAVWTRHLEDLLRERLSGRGADVEVLNAGTIAFNSTQELVLLTTELVDYRPDAIVVLDGWNDMNIATTPKPEGLPDPLAHAFFYELDTLLARGDDHLMQALRASALVRKVERELAGATADRARADDHELALARYRRNLVGMVRVAQAYGAGVLLCAQPELYHRGGEVPDAERRMRETDSDPTYGPFVRETYPRYIAVAREVAEAEQARFLDASAPFDDHPDDVCFTDWVHLTDTGHRLLAEVVVEEAMAALDDSTASR